MFKLFLRKPLVVISSSFADKSYWERINILTDAIYEVFAPIEASAFTPEEWKSKKSLLTDYAAENGILVWNLGNVGRYISLVTSENEVGIYGQRNGVNMTSEPMAQTDEAATMVERRYTSLRMHMLTIFRRVAPGRAWNPEMVTW